MSKRADAAAYAKLEKAEEALLEIELICWKEMDAEDAVSKIRKLSKRYNEKVRGI